MNTPINLIAELQWRGMIQDIMPGTEEWLMKEKVSGYIGFDPTSDSLHIGSLVPILLLVHLQRADVFVALIIIGREIAISALREWMAQIGASKSVAVHMIGKLKTVVQMVAIPFLLFDGMLFGLMDTRLWGTALIWVAAVLTVWSMAYYLQKAIPEIRARSR